MNVENIEGALETVSKLQGVEFDWVRNGNKSSGVIAQQIEKILPHLVNEDPNGLKSVNYAGLTGYFIEALKEQQKQIDELKIALNK